MSIRLTPTLACYDALLHELGSNRIGCQEHKGVPLTVGLVNLMPTRIETERQWARLLGNSEYDVALQLIHMKTRPSTHTDAEYLEKHYLTFDEVDFDAIGALIVTGAPVELMPFEAVDYWEELKMLLNVASEKKIPILSVCWGAQALMYLRYGIDKVALPQKCFGVFEHVGFSRSEKIHFPHSRHTGWSRAALLNEPALKIWIDSEEAGVFACVDEKGDWYLSGHMEYEKETLIKEYERDVSKGLFIKQPVGAHMDPQGEWHYAHTWHHSASELMKLWLDEVNSRRK